MTGGTATMRGMARRGTARILSRGATPTRRPGTSRPRTGPASSLRPATRSYSPTRSSTLATASSRSPRGGRRAVWPASQTLVPRRNHGGAPLAMPS
jgi:hypothetical protein